MALTQRMDDDLKAGLSIIKSDDQNIMLPGLMLFDTVNLLQDSPYPFAGPSGKTSRNRQLNNLFRRTGNIY